MQNQDHFAALVDDGVVEWVDDIPVVVKSFSPFDMTASEARSNTLYACQRIADPIPTTADIAKLMAENPRVSVR